MRFQPDCSWMSLTLILAMQPLRGLAMQPRMSLQPALPWRTTAPLAMAGFGAPPPPPQTLEDVVKGFGHRLPKDFGEPCMCGSGASYADCCRPYHTGKKLPETPVRALQTRYAAFAYRLPIYIIETTDTSNSDYMKDKIKWAKKLSKTSMFDQFDFSASSLGIGEVEPGDNEETVHMENSFTLQAKSSGAAPVTTYERTTFVRRKGAWYFQHGAVTSDAVGLRRREAMHSERDVAKLQKDCDYAQAIVGKMKTKNQVAE